MQVEHKKAGDVTITLNELDVDQMCNLGSVMCRYGLTGHYSKTTVYFGQSDQVSARLDGDADLHVNIPDSSGDLVIVTDSSGNLHVQKQDEEVMLPVTIERSKITGFGDRLEARLASYFGEHGGVHVVRESEVHG